MRKDDNSVRFLPDLRISGQNRAYWDQTYQIEPNEFKNDQSLTHRPLTSALSRK